MVFDTYRTFEEIALATKVYEGLFLFDSNRYSRDPSGVPAAVDAAIEEAGGKMLASRLWSEQKLAYPINGHRKGTYWLTYFSIETDKLVGINRKFQLNESILRNLVLSVDERLVEPLVQHATGVVKPEEPETKEPAATEAAPADTEAAATTETAE